MKIAQIEQAATLLAQARWQNRLVDEIPESVRPRTLAEAYAIQARLVELLEMETCGWFCACTNEKIQSRLGLYEPYYARLLKPFVFESGAVLQSTEYPPLVLECEFGFRLGRDLPSKKEPYTREDIESAVQSVHPTIEVVAGHLKNWPEQDVFSVIADNGTDGALIYGEAVTDWEHLDLKGCAVNLTVNGEVIRRGVGADVLGNPVDAMVWLANARSRDGDGLRKGDIHNTGTATDIAWVNAGDTAVAEFSGLGNVELIIE